MTPPPVDLDDVERRFPMGATVAPLQKLEARGTVAGYQRGPHGEVEVSVMWKETGVKTWMSPRLLRIIADDGKQEVLRIHIERPTRDQIREAVRLDPSVLSVGSVLSADVEAELRRLEIGGVKVVRHGLAVDATIVFPDESNVMLTAEQVQADPAASNWLKQAIADALNRDLVDALGDAETLAEVLRGRADAMLR